MAVDFDAFTPASAGGSQAGPAVFRSSIAVSRPSLDTLAVVEVVALRPAQYGIPLAQRRTFLQTLLPNGSPSYVGLFTTAPDRAGLGGVEVSGGTYARTAHSVWRHATIGGFVARRSNGGEVRLPTVTQVIVAQGWGAWDAATGGNLVAFGLLRAVDLQARIFTFAVGDTPVFGDGLLRTGIQ